MHIILYLLKGVLYFFAFFVRNELVFNYDVFMASYLFKLRRYYEGAFCLRGRFTPPYPTMVANEDQT